MSNKIAILLSTYNGEKYLEKQLQSILNQDHKNWELYIRDDGSDDSTTDIIENFCRIYSNIYFFKKDNINRGAAGSFMYLLEHVESDYYMFCDQDDFWYSNKISTVFNILLENNNTPCLVFSDAKVVDQNLKIIDNSFWSYNKTPPDLMLYNPEFIAVYNCAPGCTMIFNKALKNHLADYDSNMIMHDWYVLIKALQKGTVKYSNKALMMYRQHQNNALGADKISISDRFSKIFRMKKSFNTQIKLFRFVKRYMKINIFNFYMLKLKFNLLRFKNK